MTQDQHLVPLSIVGHIHGAYDGEKQVIQKHNPGKSAQDRPQKDHQAAVSLSCAFVSVECYRYPSIYLPTYLLAYPSIYLPIYPYISYNPKPTKP